MKNGDKLRISSQTHYGLQASIILAKSYPETVSASELEKIIGVSSKYLERVMRSLSCAGLVVASRGASGGYALSRKPEEITAGEVIRALENELKIVGCVDAPCKKRCESLFVWRRLYEGINEILDSITLNDAMNGITEKK